MRRHTSSLSYTTLRALGIPAAVRSFRNAAVVLCYHNVVAEPPPELMATGLHISQARFRAQMRWLATHYTVIPLRELIARARAARPLRKIAAVTFDDAYRGVFDYAWPILRELDLPATVFVVTGAAASGQPFWWDHPEAARQGGTVSSQRWLGELRGDASLILGALGVSPAFSVPFALSPAPWDVIRAAARNGLELGVHSATHRALPQLTDVELHAEVIESRGTLARHSGVATDLFAYPYGLWDERVRNATRAGGYATGLTLNPRLVSANADPWALPRVNIPARITDSAFQAWLAGLSPHQVRPK